MTQEEIQIIIDSDIPSYEKSRLILKLIDKKNENVKTFQEGGTVEEEKEEKILHPTYTITVGDQEFEVEIADTPEKRKDGLSRVENLNENQGMLFIFEEPTNTYFTMEDTSLDLDIVFIDEDGEVIEVHSVYAYDSEPVKCDEDFVYVLEVPIGSEIEEGEELSIDQETISEEDQQRIAKSKMLILDENGDVQMKLEGGERIMSIISTKKLIKLALKAYKEDIESAYRRVGRYVMQEFNAQDNRQPQYVEAPEKKGEENGK